MVKQNLREKAAALRKQHILEAAIDVFAARGFHRATIRDVATKAGVSDGTIYNSFQNKESLLLSLLDPLSEANPGSNNVPEPPNDVNDFLRALFVRRWDSFTPLTLAVLRTVFSEALINHHLRAQYMRKVIGPAVTLPEPFFARFIAANTVKPVDIPMTLRIITATFIGLVMMRLLGDAYITKHWAQVPDQVASIFLEGLVAKRTAGVARDSV